MFGYVTVNKPELRIREYAQYKAYYCGLCQVLKKEYGKLGQITLTYDMTFLIILLTSLYEEPTICEKHSCVIHPVKKQPMNMNDVTQYAADMNIALSYHHFLDDWKDEKDIKGFVGARAFERKYRKIAKKYPEKCKVIEESLKKLAHCEQQKETDIDVVSRGFGELMAELFVYKKDGFEEVLRRFGFYLGKFIYILDAYMDIEEDIKKGCYNPFSEKRQKEGFEDQCKQMLLLVIAEATREFEKLPCIRDVEILRNILYEGVWAKYERKRNNDNGSL